MNFDTLPLSFPSIPLAPSDYFVIRTTLTPSQQVLTQQSLNHVLLHLVSSQALRHEVLMLGVLYQKFSLRFKSEYKPL